jgi:integrase
MTVTQFTTILQSLLVDLGLKGYSGHSFRRGGASHALACGVPAEVIKAQGDWRSLSYLDYLNVDVVEGRVKHVSKMT